MSLFGTRQLIDITFASLTERCAKACAKARLSRNEDGALSLSTVKPDGTMGSGIRIRCDEATEAELPRKHEAWYQPAIVGVAEAGWDEPKAWKATKADTKATPPPQGLTAAE